MKNITSLHKFFVKESKTYAAPFTWRTYLYYPIAYIRFMYFSLRDK